MLYQIEPDGDNLIVTRQFMEKSASELGIQEKAIEDWISENPKLLLPNEEVLVIGQSVAGQHMADILALDTLGRLVVVEIKRDWSDRATVAQLLEYAANLKGSGYEKLNELAEKYFKEKNVDLITAFRGFTDNEDIQKEEIGLKQRVFIVAPDADEGLKNIVTWLKSYGVPIDFIPFKIISDSAGKTKFIQIEGVQSEPEFAPEDDDWAGHWIFNTNESYAPGAYERMFKQGVIAIYGYPNGPRNLMRGVSKDDKVFAYVNSQGIRALGTIVSGEVTEGKGIFIDNKGKQHPDEFHMRVKWNHILSKNKALSNREASSLGYNLPIRTVFGRLHRGRFAKKLEETINNRS